MSNCQKVYYDYMISIDLYRCLFSFYGFSGILGVDGLTIFGILHVRKGNNKPRRHKCDASGGLDNDDL